MDMVSKEKKREELSGEGFSWCFNGIGTTHYSHRRLRQSPWLQANLSEVEEKIKTMVSIVEEEGDSFAKRAEMFYKRRPQLLEVLDDLHKSYSCLAFNYHQLLLRCDLNRLNHHNNTNMNMNITPTSNAKFLVLCTSNEEKLVETPQTVFEMVEKSSSSGGSDNNGNITTNNNVDDQHCLECCCSRDRMWSEKEVSELIEEHMRQQAELVKRNEDKRVKIKELCSQIKMLMDENQAFKSKNNITSSKGTLYHLGKLTGCSR